MTHDLVLKSFFNALMDNAFDMAWKQFSKKSQTLFLEWTLKDLFERHKEACEFAELTTKEVNLLLEMNDFNTTKHFWKKFYFSCNVFEIFRFGTFNQGAIQGSEATVLIDLLFPDGRTAQIPFKMVNESGGWKVGYVESGFPFE